MQHVEASKPHATQVCTSINFNACITEHGQHSACTCATAVSRGLLMGWAGGSAGLACVWHRDEWGVDKKPCKPSSLDFTGSITMDRNLQNEVWWCNALSKRE